MRCRDEMNMLLVVHGRHAMCGRLHQFATCIMSCHSALIFGSPTKYRGRSKVVAGWYVVLGVMFDAGDAKAKDSYVEIMHRDP